MVRTLTVEDLEALKEERDDLVIIDTLDPDSYQARHIPGAINIPFDHPHRFAERVRAAVPERDTPIVTYCYDEDCDLSPAAAVVLEEELGYSKVHEFPGGLVGWRRAGNEWRGTAARVVPSQRR